MTSFAEVTLKLLEGFGTTCYIFILTLVLALPLGLIVAFGSMSRFKPLRYVVRTIVWIIRGTPLMLQLIVIFYGPGLLFGVTGFDRVPSVIVAFVINYACYFSEIYRGGILAPMSNEVITLVKDTSLARIISVVEIIKSAEAFMRQGLIWPLFYTGVFYLLFIGILTLLFRYAEKKTAYLKV